MIHNRDALDVATALQERSLQDFVMQASVEPTMVDNLLPLPVQDANSIQELTAKMKDGDEAAFSEFYERYCDRLFRYLIVLTRGDEDRSRDLLQAPRRWSSWIETIRRDFSVPRNCSEL